MEIEFTDVDKQEQRLLSISVAYMVSFMAILSCVNQLGNLIGIHTILDTIICYTLLVVLVILGIFKSIQKGLNVDVVLITLFIVLYWIFSYLIFNSNKHFMLTSLTDFMGNPLYILFIYSLPCLIIIRKINDYDIFNYYMVKFSYVVVVLSVLVYFFARGTTSGQYMTLSYNMLVHVLYLVFNKKYKWGIIHWIIVILGVFVIIFGGARGALLGFVLPIVIYELLKKRPSNKKVFILSILLILTVVIFIYYKPLMLGADRVLRSIGVESTTINKFLNYGEDFSSGRITYYEYLWNKKNIIGYGLYGDRVLLLQLGRNNSYAHNMFLEWIIDYGVFIGSLVCCSFTFLLLYSIGKNQEKCWKHILLFLSLGFVAPMLSGSYLSQEPCIFALIGLCLNAISKKEIYIVAKNRKSR